MKRARSKGDYPRIHGWVYDMSLGRDGGFHRIPGSMPRMLARKVKEAAQSVLSFLK